MSATGKLGTIDSQLGNIVLGLTIDLTQVVMQSLSFVQDANGDAHRFDSADTLSLIQVASFNVDRAVSASNTLAFAQAASQGTVFNESVTDTLSLTDDAEYVHDIPVAVSQSLSLVQSADVRGPIPVAASNTLTLVGVATQQGPIYQEIHDRLNFVEVVDGHNETITVSVGQVLNFVQKAGRVLTASVSQSLSFTQTAERRNSVADTLAFVQSATVGKGGDVSQELDLVDSVTVTGIFSRSISDSLGLHQSVTYFVDSGCLRFNYSPFVGSTTDTEFTPPLTTAPALSTHKLRLTYPYVMPSLSITLPNPSFSNKDRLTFNRINRETRGGTLIVYADPKWPKQQVLSLQVDNMSPNQANDMLAFLRASLGKEIGLLDWENRQWRGIIITPDARITHVGREDRSIAFDFQGQLV